MIPIRTGDLTILISAGDIRRFALARELIQRPIRKSSKIRYKVHIPVERRLAAIPSGGTPEAIAKANPMTQALQAIRQTQEIHGFTDPAAPGLEAIQQALASPRHPFIPKGLSLFIEEPEIHLDPARQEVVARTLAQAVNYGIKVFLTTQSEWIAREINDCVIIGTLLQAKDHSLAHHENLIKKYGYRKDHGISRKQVKAYELKGGMLTPCKVNRYGIYSHVMDDFIDGSNEAHNALSNHI